MAARSRHHPTAVAGSPKTKRNAQTVEPRQMSQSSVSMNVLTPHERMRRSRLLGGSVLVSIVIFFSIIASIAIPRIIQGTIFIAPLEVMWLSVGIAWLVLVYLCQRFGHFVLGGWLFVLILFVLQGAGIYYLPAYRPLFFAASSLPIALAALLIGFQAVYIVSFATALLILLGWWLSVGMPTPLPPELLLSGSILLLILILVALVLGPLRRTSDLLSEQVQAVQRNALHLESRVAANEQQLEEERTQHLLERRHINAVFERLSDGLISTDGDGRIVYANQVARQLWSELYDDDLEGRNVNVILARLRGNSDEYDSPSSLTKQIELRPVVREEQQQGMGKTYILVDSRERARLTRLRGELLELLAREMHDPLTSMLTALEMILGEKNLPDGADRVLVGARRSGQRLQNLMETLREVNSLEESRDVLRRAPTALRAVLESGIAQTAPQAQQSSVHVVAEYSTDAVLLLDKERLLRAFVNLLYNALRQSPPYSTVHVQTQRSGGSIVVRITDQGPGLPPEVQSTIFSRLSSLPDERAGSALGLTFSRLVIEAHGGRIWVESNGGQGSTFAFSLPLEANKA